MTSISSGILSNDGKYFFPCASWFQSDAIHSGRCGPPGLLAIGMAMRNPGFGTGIALIDGNGTRQAFHGTASDEGIMETIPMTMQSIMQAASARCKTLASVQKCLSYPDLLQMPPTFNRLAHTDFAVLSEAGENLDWEDYCPAYALGILAFEGYCRDSSHASEAALKKQWDEHRGSSRLGWGQARTIIGRSWNTLARLEGKAGSASYPDLSLGAAHP